MLHVKASAPTPSFAGRQGSQPKSPALLSNMSQSDSLLASALLIVPVYDEQQHGADLLMLPIFTPEAEEKKADSPQQDRRCQATRNQNQHQHKHQPSEPASRTMTPAAPTPPPKPQLPDGCQDWDHYLSQKKSTMTLPIYFDNRSIVEDRQQIRSPELNFNHSFETVGWRDCISQRHKPQDPQRCNAAELRRRPSAATVGCGASMRARRLSTASTLTTHTTSATAPILGSSSMSIRSAKRLSNASTLTFSTINSVKKPRGLRRICHSRHLRTYYSEGTSLLIRAASVGGGSLRRRGQNRTSTNATATIKEQREPIDRQQQRRRGVVVNHENDGCSIKSYNTGKKRLSTFSTLSMPVSLTEYSAPPPYPPPGKPLPSLPTLTKVKTAMTSEVRELQTKERTKWRDMLLKGFHKMDTGRRRIHI